MSLKIIRWGDKGFTLAELLVTITILVILGLTILIGLNPMAQLMKGYDARRKADLYKLRTAFESYYEDHDCYPPNIILQHCGGDDLEPYLKSIPCDPQTGKAYKLTLVPDNACPQRYAIYSTLMSPSDSELKYPECPGMMAVTSPNMTYIDTVNACAPTAGRCAVYYGCSLGACTVISVDKEPVCQNLDGTTYCDADCGGQVNCAAFNNRTQTYINDCNPE